MKHIQTVIEALRDADQKGALHTSEVLTGYSGHKLYGFLQRIASAALWKEKCYLEIGVFQGLTLLSSAMANKDATFYGIDNFAFFDPQGTNEALVNSRVEQLELNNVALINQDYEDALEALEDHIGSKKVGLYFVDGPHDYRSQLMCMELAKPYLSEDAIIVVDDSNYEHVRQANADFLKLNPDYKLLFESYTSSHPKRMNSFEKSRAEAGWWNGVNILVRDPENQLSPMYPQTERSRSWFEDDHIVHSMEYPDRVISYYRWAHRFIGWLPIWDTPRKKGLFKSMNTFSESLQETWNETITLDR